MVMINNKKKGEKINKIDKIENFTRALKSILFKN